MSNSFARVRTFVFRTAILFAAIALALGALIINYTIFNFDFFFIFAALNVATASLTILTLPIMLLVSRYRKGAFTSMVAVEVGWTFVLWVLWLSSGALIPSVFPEDVCVFALAEFGLLDSPLCSFDQSLTAFAFLTWILLFGYNMTLVVLVIRHQTRGHANVWTGYVLEIDFSAPGPSSTHPSESNAHPSEYKGNNNGVYSGNVPHQYPPVEQDRGYIASAHPSGPKDNKNDVYMGNVPHQYPPVDQDGGYVAQPAAPITPQTTMTPLPQV